MAISNDPKMLELRADIAEHLEEISKMFSRPAKISILVRFPSLSTASVFLSDDDLEAAIKAIRDLHTDPATLEFPANT